MVKSAAIGCVFSAIPLPTNKVEATLVGAGALEGATEGFANNIINQYNTLKDTYSLIDIPEQVNWQSAFSDAATQGMTQAVLMLVTRNIGQSQKIQSLGKKIAEKAKIIGTAYYRGILRTAGLSDDVIDALFTKLNINLGKITFPTIAKVIPSTGTLPKSFFEIAGAYFPLNSTQIQRVISSSASDFNKVAEKIILEKFLKEGFKELPAKFGSNNGIDILLVDSKDFSKLTKMIIIEVKSYPSKTVPTTTTLDICYNFRQMTDGWIEA